MKIHCEGGHFCPPSRRYSVETQRVTRGGICEALLGVILEVEMPGHCKEWVPMVYLNKDWSPDYSCLYQIAGTVSSLPSLV